MSKNGDRRGAALPFRAVCAGVIRAAAVTAALLFAGAVLISQERLGENLGTALICTSSFAGALVGGFAAGRGSGRAYVLYGTGLGVLLFCLRTALAVIGGRGGVFGSFAMQLLAALLTGGFLGGLMAGKRRKKRRKRG